MKLIIDNREPFLYDKCKTTFSLPSIEISLANLTLGDISLHTNDGKECIIFERKSLADLLASIKDGRYEEQSHRLIHSSGLHTHNIIYIIEGVFSQLRTEQERRLVYSTMASLNTFKGFSVIRTSSVTETAEFIMVMADKIERNLKNKKQFAFSKTSPPSHEVSVVGEDNSILNSEPTDNIHETVNIPIDSPAQPANYTSVVKKVKKENITAQNIAEVILCQIPGVSSITASQIMKHFTGLWDLVNSAKNNPEKFEDIYLETNGKKRKLSKTVISFLREISI